MLTFAFGGYYCRSRKDGAALPAFPVGGVTASGVTATLEQLQASSISCMCLTAW